MTKFCPKCGKELEDDDQFCVGCGHKLKSNSKNISKTNNQTKDSSKSNLDSKNSLLSNKKIKYGLIALIIVIIVITVIFASGILTLEKYNIKITETSVTNYSSNSSSYYAYDVSALISPVPSNDNHYIIQTEYFDSNGKSLYISTNSVDDMYLGSAYSSMVGCYMPDNYQIISKVTVQLLDNHGNILGESSSDFNMDNYKNYTS